MVLMKEDYFPSFYLVSKPRQGKQTNLRTNSTSATETALNGKKKIGISRNRDRFKRGAGTKTRSPVNFPQYWVLSFNVDV